MDLQQIDSIDRKILQFLQKDSRTAFTEIARQIGCSGGTIHGRVSRLKESGIISGQKVVIDKSKLGYELEAFLGISVDQASRYSDVATELGRISEVLEIHYTTGSYNLLAKVAVKNAKHLFELLSQKIQLIDNVRSTDTLVVLESLLTRDISL